MRLCGEEIIKVKAQLELNLVTTVKNNKKCFYEYINKKRRTKENHQLLLEAGGGEHSDKRSGKCQGT